MPFPSQPQFDPMRADPQAAVALIRTVGGDPEYLFLRRAVNPDDPWSGHFALPGGRWENGDKDLLETCIRETREECGIELNASQLVRPLPIATAGLGMGRPMVVAPFLFEIPLKPKIALAEFEIADYHWLALSFLRDPANQGRAALSGRHPEIDFPFIHVGRDKVDAGAIWGFTYGVLKSLWESEAAR